MNMDNYDWKISVVIGFVIAVILFGAYLGYSQYIQGDETETEKLDINKVEKLTATYVNLERQDVEVSNLTFDTHLSLISYYHSKDMASNNYFAHRSPSGEDVIDRYNRFDYECSTGYAERIMKVYYKSEFNPDYRNSTVTYTTNEELARGIKEYIMHTDYREEILDPNYDSQGIGIYRYGDQIYVTHNIC